MPDQIVTFGPDTSRRIYDSLSGPTASATVSGEPLANRPFATMIMRVSSALSAAGTVGATLTVGSGSAYLCKQSGTTLTPDTGVTHTVYNTHNAAIPVDTWIFVFKHGGRLYFHGAIQYCPT